MWEVPAGDASVADARDAVDDVGLADATIQELESDDGRELRVEAEPLERGGVRRRCRRPWPS